MFSATDGFSVSGPSHLRVVDWENLHHRRAILASLVQGAYQIESDRQGSHHGKPAQAPPYWEFFQFRLKQTLDDKSDGSIFGVIYENINKTEPNVLPNNANMNSPTYVIAFRGTLLKSETGLKDLWLDFSCIFNTIHQSSRVKSGTQIVEKLCDFAGHSNVWIVGHSLGSAIALLVGKNMVKLGFPLVTYLFNPPYIAAPFERIKEERLRDGIYITGSVVKAGLSAIVKGARHHHDKKRNNSSHGDYRHVEHADDIHSFAMLSSWFPCMFINQADMICSGYITYFANRKKMEDIGAGRIGKLATMTSVESILASALGKKSESYDLLPSAVVTVNMTPAPDSLKAHNLEQWWNPNFHYHLLIYKFNC